MAIQNYWVNKDELETEAVKVISECLDDCIASNLPFSSGNSLKDWIGLAVKNAINPAHLGFYKVKFDVRINTDIVFADLGQGQKQYLVVTHYENISVEML